MAKQQFLRDPVKTLIQVSCFLSINTQVYSPTVRVFTFFFFFLLRTCFSFIYFLFLLVFRICLYSFRRRSVLTFLPATAPRPHLSLTCRPSPHLPFQTRLVPSLLPVASLSVPPASFTSFHSFRPSYFCLTVSPCVRSLPHTARLPYIHRDLLDNMKVCSVLRETDVRNSLWV